NWWIGMKWHTVQLMVYGKNLNEVNVSSSINGLNILNVNSNEKDDSFKINQLSCFQVKPL
ncbi:cyclomaltodextrinase N-terminal domain-containing protein, partial [bacterium BMS3Abin03]|nr:cyclomaltodextrinase N-terminal domain-containing protein [bacterium BMS3Abin03]